MKANPRKIPSKKVTRPVIKQAVGAAKMTEKQIMFCKEYLVDFNATKAAIRSGYSKNTAAEQGYQLLHKTSVQNFIKELSAPVEDKLGITRERTMQEIGRLAFSDIRKFFTVDGGLKKIQDIDDDSAAALAGIESYEEKVSDKDSDENIVVGTNRKIKTYDKTKALEMLAKHFKIYDDGAEKHITININGQKAHAGG